MTGEGGESPARGRARERAILAAVVGLLGEVGYEAMTMDAVAARAHASKTTIYRRWPGKEDLLLDAVACLKAPLPEPRGLSVRDDLLALLEAMCEQFADPCHMREFALLLGEGAAYPRLMTRYTETVIEPRREVIRAVLRRGAVTGELREDIDVDAALFMMIGSVLARSRYGDAPVEPGYARRVVDEMLSGIGAR